MFEYLNLEEMKTLKDTKSEKASFMPIKVKGENVYVTEPDGKLISNIQGQQKCDYLIYCQDKPQTCFIELKGENISIKDSYNPYDQIGATLKFLKEEKELKVLVVEEHSIIGGLGTAVCEVLAEEMPVKVLRIGIKDEFGKSGPAKELIHKYGLDAESIYGSTKKFLKESMETL